MSIRINAAKEPLDINDAEDIFEKVVKDVVIEVLLGKVDMLERRIQDLEEEIILIKIKDKE